MEIEDGKLYFLKNSFFKKYKHKYNLLDNMKQNTNKRPSYFCIRDIKDPEILWFIPLSRQYKKYYNIYLEKQEKNKQNKTNYPIHNFVFSDNIAGTKCVFLIQNIFPIVEKYIDKEYTRNDQPVIVPNKTKREVIDKVKKVLKNAASGRDYTTFTQPLEFKKDIVSEMIADKNIDRRKLLKTIQK